MKFVRFLGIIIPGCDVKVSKVESTINTLLLLSSEYQFFTITLEILIMSFRIDFTSQNTTSSGIIYILNLYTQYVQVGSKISKYFDIRTNPTLYCIFSE